MRRLVDDAVARLPLIAPEALRLSNGRRAPGGVVATRNRTSLRSVRVPENRDGVVAGPSRLLEHHQSATHRMANPDDPRSGDGRQLLDQ